MGKSTKTLAIIFVLIVSLVFLYASFPNYGSSENKDRISILGDTIVYTYNYKNSQPGNDNLSFMERVNNIISKVLNLPTSSENTLEFSSQGNSQQDDSFETGEGTNQSLEEEDNEGGGFQNPGELVRTEPVPGEPIITDQSSGLVWQDSSSEGTKNWSEVHFYCENLDWAGYDDWRLASYTDFNRVMNISETWNDWPDIFNSSYYPNCWQGSLSQEGIKSDGRLKFLPSSPYEFQFYLVKTAQEEYKYYNYITEAIGIRVRCVRGAD